MSIHTLPIKKLFNTLAADTVSVAGGVLSIKGLPPINVDDIVSCSKQCSVDCTKQVATITPIVPTTPCECPYEWNIKIARKVCYFGLTENDALREEMYTFSSPTGSTPTVSEIIDHLVDEINNNPYSVVTATKVGGGPYTAMILTEKDCDGEHRTCGFNYWTSASTNVATTAHVSAKLTAEDQLRAWPIQPGSFGERPETALCGDYCVYKFTVKPLGTTRDQNFANAYVQREGSFELWVNADLANFATDWNDELVAIGLSCWTA